MLDKVKLSASIVLYKPDWIVLSRTITHLQAALRYAASEFDLEMTVSFVDNSMDDSWAAEIEQRLNEIAQTAPENLVLKYVRSPSNSGYGHGNNLAIEQAISNYHLVINPDLFVEQDSVLQALRYMQSNTDCGLLVPAVFGEDGERHYLCKRNPTLFVMFLRSFAPAWMQKLFQSKLDSFEMKDRDYDAVMTGVEFPSGCFMFFRTSLLRQLGGFDTRFFMYFEDADIGRRMGEIAQVVYVPMVKVVHKWARGTHRNWHLRLITIRSALIYWKKWGGIF